MKNIYIPLTFILLIIAIIVIVLFTTRGKKQAVVPVRINRRKACLLHVKNKVCNRQPHFSFSREPAVTTLTDTKRGIEISFKDSVFYDPGKADLKESSFKTLDGLAEIIKLLPNPISIEGYSDNVPIGNAAFKSNWELSAARAASVLHYFESKSISENRLKFTGFGEFKPLYLNDTKEHRQANRRVNIVILRMN